MVFGDHGGQPGVPIEEGGIGQTAGHLAQMHEGHPGAPGKHGFELLAQTDGQGITHEHDALGAGALGRAGRRQARRQDQGRHKHGQEDGPTRVSHVTPHRPPRPVAATPIARDASRWQHDNVKNATPDGLRLLYNPRPCCRHGPSASASSSPNYSILRGA